MEEIKVKNLTFAYPNCETDAIKNISFDVERGELLLITGKSGCGKSTLLRLLKPIIAPHGNINGEIYVFGKKVCKLGTEEQSRKIGFVMQNPDSQIVCDKVWHELAFGLENLSYDNSEIRTRVAEMASYFGIEDWFHKDVSTLSGGQKQLLNLASVMVMRPSVLILDEPTSQLDPIAAREFLETVKRINNELGTTVIISEHRLNDVFPMSDRVIVMQEGKIISDSTPSKTGKVLLDLKSDMFSALPVPIKIYCSKEKDGNSPITVSEGRNWLSGQTIVNEVTLDDPERPSEKLLTAQNLWYRYDKNSPDVLKGLSFELRKGEIYAILGGNGTGKTTAVSVVSGINKPYRGKVKLKEGVTLSYLSQNPQDVFSKNTVIEELKSVLSDAGYDKETESVKLSEIINFAELEKLLYSHPYDLSGGEQQRTAIALALLNQPDILILDEPTKGIDWCFKERFASLLNGMKQSGISVIIVSHDVEFCAKYADVCGMLFDGKIISEDVPKRFFKDKCFYTTSANKMANGIIENAVLEEDIAKALDVRIKKIADNSKKGNKTIISREMKEKDKPKTNIILATVFISLFACLMLAYFKTSKPVFELLGLVSLMVSVFCFIPQNEFSVTKNRFPKNIPKSTIAASIIVLAAVPLTVFFGIKFLGDRKYYFISLLIILESFLPFAVMFEVRKPRVRELVIISVLCGISVAGREIFAAIPQFKPVVATVIISGICFGSETGFLVGAVTAFVSNFFFGQGPWTPWQMFSLGIIGFIAGVLFTRGIIRKSKLGICLFGFLSSIVIYGGIMNPASVIMSQSKITPKLLIMSYSTGFVFDLMLGISTVIFLWIFAKPFIEKLERVKLKYGI